MTDRTCSLCPRPHYGHDYCAAHWKRWYKTGDPMPDVPIGELKPVAVKDPEYAAYVARHRNVRRRRGPAKNFPCEHCKGRQATTWAQIHETSGESAADYMPLCWPCHATYDDFMGRVKDCDKKHSPQTREKLRQAAKRRFEDPEERKRVGRKVGDRCANGHLFGPPGNDGKRRCKICLNARLAASRAERKARKQEGAAPGDPLSSA